jgi:hypothetical protein
MLDVVNHEQYMKDYAAHPDAQAAVGALVLRAARTGTELTERTLDFAIESFGRHDLHAREFDALVGDITLLPTEDAEERLRLLHVSLELVRAEGSAIRSTSEDDEAGDSGATSVERVNNVRNMMELVQRVELLTEEKTDAESIADLADAYRIFLLANRRLPVDPTGETVTPAQWTRIANLAKASAHELQEFLGQRYGYAVELPDHANQIEDNE